ncbi:SLC13 family permease [Thermomonas sp.]|uniref:SLC13 family permease n=1 Tax=Thermomonas sp. TaxID=1971895 RepID=UPI0024871960|nr:SLC13 family permease [Thermomonas sp.]MDI1253998.1 SLC13 family permease [Thermomonas sp.]
MTLQLAVTLAVLAGAVFLFVTEKLAIDVIALLVLSALLVTGVLTPAEALSGFSNPATITVAAMFVLSSGLQHSGVIGALGDQLARIRRGWLFALVMMILAAGLSAFVNNTAVVAVFLPMVIATVSANRLAPSKFLIPLSFAAQFGGVCTLVGTSTNLLVDSLARQSGLSGFSVLEFAPLGIWFVGVGMIYLMLARTLLPDLGVPAAPLDERRGRFLTELIVGRSSSVIGKTGGVALPLETGDAYLLEIRRDGVLLDRPRSEPIQRGDRLLLRGSWPVLDALRAKLNLSFDPVASDLSGNPDEERVHARVMVAPGSHLAGHTLAELRFGHSHRALVHGLQRASGSMRLPPHHVVLAVGDILMLDAPKSSLDIMRADPGLVLLGEQRKRQIDWWHAIASVLVIAAAVGMAALGWLPIVATALLGSIALVMLRCLRSDEAYSAVDWRVIVLLAGLLPLGIALQKTGGADWMARHALGSIADHGPVVTLAAIYLITAVMTEVMSNNAAAVLVVPIAISTAHNLGVDPKPFLVAVAFAASTSFATPVGYQTNTMVYTAGGYRFIDFPKIGIPLNLLFWGMAIILIPRYFPF